MEQAKIDKLKSTVRDVPNFPSKGVLFRDLTTLIKDPEAFQIAVDETVELYKNLGITKVVGIESRGFIVGSAVAYKLGAGFVPARKPGKLPAITIKQSYSKEYGVDSIELHRDAIDSNDVVLLYDDVLATGGTMKAAYDLVKSLNPKKVYINFTIELAALNGRPIFPADVEITSLLNY